MTEEDMKLAGIYRDENGIYKRCPRTKEEQEMFDEYARLRDKAEKDIEKLFEGSPTQENWDIFSKFVNEHHQKRPDSGEINKLIDRWRVKMGMVKDD